jgi:hypothetical protein
MADARFLHIRSRDADSPRVLPLSGSAVRIGRGRQCEVQLGEPALADVQCLLRRRGKNWHVQPVGPPGRLSIEGRPVEHPRTLSIGVPLRVGHHWLTLRPADESATRLGTFDAPITVEPGTVFVAPIPPVRPVPLSERSYADPTRVIQQPAAGEGQREPARDWRARIDEHERWLQSRRSERRAPAATPQPPAAAAPPAVRSMPAAPAERVESDCLYERECKPRAAETDDAEPKRSWRFVPRTEKDPKADPEPARTVDEWPSARSILDASRATPTQRGEPRPRTRVGPAPTVPAAPACWCLPGWLVVFPAVAGLVVGSLFLNLTWTWGQDALAAGIVADRICLGPAPKGPIDLPEAGAPTWWGSTSSHLHLRAFAASRAQNDPERAERVKFLLGAARNAAPLDPAVRLALAAAEIAGETAPPASGASRDVVALAGEVRRLIAAGRQPAAVEAARAAIELAMRNDPDRDPIPAFIEEADVRRFSLPQEALVSPIVRELVDHCGRFGEWSDALPAGGVAGLVALRRLRAAGSPDGDAALTRVLAQPATDALTRAAQGEALALDGRWSEAARCYQEAVRGAPEGLIRRTWWVNLSSIGARLGDARLVRLAYAAARGPSPGDVINKRLLETRAHEGVGGAGTSTQDSNDGKHDSSRR